jgi:hypothetical protein
MGQMPGNGQLAGVKLRCRTGAGSNTGAQRPSREAGGKEAKVNCDSREKPPNNPKLAAG